jgi:hypothetical protein
MSVGGWLTMSTVATASASPFTAGWWRQRTTASTTGAARQSNEASRLEQQSLPAGVAARAGSRRGLARPPSSSRGRRQGGAATRMALCITGEHRNVAEHFTMDSIQAYLVGFLPQRPDLYLMSTPSLPNGTRMEQLAVHVERTVDMSVAEVRAAFANNSRAMGDFAPLEARSIRKGCGHHSFCGFVRQIRTTHDCWQAIQGYERRHRFRYAFVGRARLDMLWFGAIGPSAWGHVQDGFAVVPMGDEHDGVNDRFVLARRGDFEVYAGLYEAMRLARPPWDVWRVSNQAERLLMLQLKHGKVKLARVLLPTCLLEASPFSSKCALCKKVSDEGAKAVAIFENGGSHRCRIGGSSQVHFCRAETAGLVGTVLVPKCLTSRGKSNAISDLGSLVHRPRSTATPMTLEDRVA